MFMNITRDFSCFSCEKILELGYRLPWPPAVTKVYTPLWHQYFLLTLFPCCSFFLYQTPLCKGQRCNTIRKGVKCPATSTRGCQHGFFCESHWNQHKVSVGYTEQESSIYEEVMLLKSSKGARLQRERANKELDVQSVCLPWCLMFYSELTIASYNRRNKNSLRRPCLWPLAQEVFFSTNQPNCASRSTSSKKRSSKGLKLWKMFLVLQLVSPETNWQCSNMTSLRVVSCLLC